MPNNRFPLLGNPGSATEQLKKPRKNNLFCMTFMTVKLSRQRPAFLLTIEPRLLPNYKAVFTPSYYKSESDSA